MIVWYVYETKIGMYTVEQDKWFIRWQDLAIKINVFAILGKLLYKYIVLPNQLYHFMA